jgi:hypothetical protein
LNPDKCSWTPIGFYWDANGQWHYHLDIFVSICIPNSLGVLQALECLATSELTTIVGMVQAAAGNMLDQVAALKVVADDMGNHIHNGYLPKCLIWQTLQSMVWPSIHYPLPAMTILKEDPEAITKKLYAQLIPSKGANHNFPRVF